MHRDIEKYIEDDLEEKIVLLSGPRQVGKTTLSKQLVYKEVYLNYDASRDRDVIMPQHWDRDTELVIFDELHKMKNWKTWIKGIYDTEGVRPRLLVTGSARLHTFRKGGESLAGRHFYHRLHPFDVKEASGFMDSRAALERILEFGGFPEPFLKASSGFAKRWRRHHLDGIIREDLLDLEKVREIKSIEILTDLLRNRVGSTCSYSSLARDLQVSVPTVKHWLEILENLFVIFAVRPFHKNIARSILKEPKYYFYDTGAVKNGQAAALENAVACGMIKQLHFHEDTTGSNVSLCYIKDKEGREVDFLAVVDEKPSCMIEVKLSDDSFAKSLFHFKKFLNKEVRKFQIVQNIDRKKTAEDIKMWPAHEFLETISFS